MVTFDIQDCTTGTTSSVLIRVREGRPEDVGSGAIARFEFFTPYDLRNMAAMLDAVAPEFCRDVVSQLMELASAWEGDAGADREAARRWRLLQAERLLKGVVAVSPATDGRGESESRDT